MERGDLKKKYQCKYVLQSFVLSPSSFVSQGKDFHGSYIDIPSFSPQMFLFMVCKCWQGCEVETFFIFAQKAHGHYIILNFLGLFMTIHPPSLCRHGA